MPFNGTGTFSAVYNWATDKANNVKITASRFDTQDGDFATGLTNCICRDGQSTVTADIPFNSHKITGLGNAAADTDALNRITADGRYVQQINGGAMTATNAVSASTVDCTLGAYFTKTASGALTWTFSNPPATGSVFGFVLELTNGGTGTQTWPASVKWPGGSAPALTTSGVDLLVFITRNGGTTWRGALVQRNSA